MTREVFSAKETAPAVVTHYSRRLGKARELVIFARHHEHRPDEPQQVPRRTVPTPLGSQGAAARIGFGLCSRFHCGARRSAIGVWVPAIAVAILASACGRGPSVPAVIQPQTSTTLKTVALTAERVLISPQIGLQDGQQVTVRVQGFRTGVPGIKFFLSECQSPSQVNPLGCGSQLAAQPFGLTGSNGDGSGSVSFTVQSSAATRPLTSVLVPCAGTCVVAATTGANGNYAFAPIAFAG